MTGRRGNPQLIGTRRRWLLLGVFALGELWLTSLSKALHAAEAPEFRLIVHLESPVRQISREFLSQAFLKNVSRWEDGEAIHPVDQRPDTLVRRKFSDRVLKRSVAAVKIYWQQRIFSGRGVPPPELDADEAIVDYVRRKRGAVGYVSGNTDISKVKEILLR
jgi:hypothetical protein